MKIKILLLNALLCTSMLCFSQDNSINDGITSPTHQKYMGKIVFALKADAIAFGSEKESEFVTKATWGSEIYYRPYFDSSLVNYLTNRNQSASSSRVYGTWKIKFYIDGVETAYKRMQTDFFTEKHKKTATTFKGALKSLKADAGGEAEFESFMLENESKFTEGDHVLKIELIPCVEHPWEFDGPVVASGEITLSIKKALVDPNDVKACLPKALMNDKILEANILKAYNAKGWEDKPVKVRIVSSQWNIEKHKRTGAILSRYVDAVIGVTKDNKCSYTTYSFRQDYDGKTYQKDVYLSGVGSIVFISCGCFK